VRYLRVIWRAGPLSCGTAPQQWALPYFITDQQSGTTNMTPTPREASVTSQQKRRGTGVTLTTWVGRREGALPASCTPHAAAPIISRRRRGWAWAWTWAWTWADAWDWL